MRRVLRTILVASAGSVVSATGALAQRVLSGQVQDPDGAPVAYANVDLGAKRTVARMRDEFLPHLLATAAEVSDRASALRVG